jgi:hypothetical protein
MAPVFGRSAGVDAVVTLLTDYGDADEYAGVCRGVIAERAPDARVIDISHGVPAFDVRAGARMLRAALPHMPEGVHVAIVDPGVGAEQNRALAVATRGGARILVGPDNGLLAPSLELFGGPSSAVELATADASPTFHGRDVYAPAAARLANGEEFAALGRAVDVTSLAPLPSVEIDFDGSTALVRIAAVDHFGNLILDLDPAEAPFAGPWRVGREGLRAAHGRTFSDAGEGELIVYVGSSGALEVGANRASAAELLGVSRGERLALEPG